jgi:transcriptional regulator with XRE-family HTH domain
MSTVQPGGEPPAGPPGPIVLRMMLGNQLHRLREAAGVTPDEAGYEIRASRSKISRMENGRVGFKERDVADLLTLYGVTGEQQRAEMLSLARQANAPVWWSNYSDLLAGPDPPRVWSVIDEAALRRPVGGRTVMRAQLDHLTEVAQLPYVTIQIVPFGTGAYAAASGSFSILRFAGPDLPDVVYVEQLTTALFLEKRDDVDHYMEVMNHLSTQALPPAHTATFLTEITRET